MESTNIRAHGDRDYWDKVGIWASTHRTSTAALVKDLIDKAIGDDLQSIKLSSFHSNIAVQQISNMPEKTEHA